MYLVRYVAFTLGLSNLGRDSFVITLHAIVGSFLSLHNVVMIFPNTRRSSTIYGVTEHVRCEYFDYGHDRLNGISQRHWVIGSSSRFYLSNAPIIETAVSEYVQ